MVSAKAVKERAIRRTTVVRKGKRIVCTSKRRDGAESRGEDG